MERRVRLLAVGALLTTALLIPILLVPSNATLLVDELMEDPSDRIGKEISVRGEVVNGSIDLDNHRLVLNGTSHDLDVDLLTAEVSGGLSDGRTIFVQGRLAVDDGGSYVLVAEVIKTSCPSKYEAEA